MCSRKFLFCVSGKLPILQKGDSSLLPGLIWEERATPQAASGGLAVRARACVKSHSALQSHGKGQFPQILLWDSVSGNPSASSGTLWGRVWPLRVSLREVRLQSVPWDRKCGCLQCQAQTRAEFIHPSSDPSDSSRVVCSQLISCNSLKPHACMGKMQPSVLEGNLTCQEVYWRKYQQWWLHWKGFCAKSAWGYGGNTSRSSAVQVPFPQQGSALGPLTWAEMSPKWLHVEGFCSLGAWRPWLVLLSCVGSAPVPHQCCLPDMDCTWMAMGKMGSTLPSVHCAHPGICLPLPKVSDWLCEL